MLRTLVTTLAELTADLDILEYEGNTVVSVYRGSEAAIIVYR